MHHLWFFHIIDLYRMALRGSDLQAAVLWVGAKLKALFVIGDHDSFHVFHRVHAELWVSQELFHKKEAIYIGGGGGNDSFKQLIFLMYMQHTCSVKPEELMVWTTLKQIDRLLSCTLVLTWSNVKTHAVGPMAKSIRHGFRQAHIPVLLGRERPTKNQKQTFATVMSAKWNTTTLCQYSWTGISNLSSGMASPSSPTSASSPSVTALCHQLATVFTLSNENGGQPRKQTCTIHASCFCTLPNWWRRCSTKWCCCSTAPQRKLRLRFGTGRKQQPHSCGR